MKKISLLFACIGIISFTANSQEKVTSKQEPVKAAPVQRVDKGAPSVAPAPVVIPAPVTEVRSEPAPVATNTSATGKVTTTASPTPKVQRTEMKTSKVPQKAVPVEKAGEQK